MGWKGKFFGALIGFLATKTVWGAVVGALIGHLFDEAGGFGYARSAFADGPTRPARPSPGAVPISDVFFRTTFELMGHVAKADGHVSEAEIGAARRLMAELRLAPHEINAAIACFRFGKSTSYHAESSVETLRAACAARHDLLRAFVELQLRAALVGNGLSMPSRTILTQVAERLGVSGMEFAFMEAALRAQEQMRSAGAGGGGSSGRGGGRAQRPMTQNYAELEVESGASDQEVTKAYRRQMSRHHPDKLVANGLPESMAQMAKEKTQRIQEAYEAIRAARGMR
jgi:DnaJ like chaperone protein